MVNRIVNIPKTRQHGVSLVELMISIALGLFLLAGLTYLYVGSKTSYGTQSAVARAQESLRFAFEYLSFDLRMAGFTGCANSRNSTPQVIANNPPISGFGLGWAVRGYQSGSGWVKPSSWSSTSPSPIAGTDVIEIYYMDSDCGSNLVYPYTTGAQLFIASNGCGFEDGEALIVSDCRRADVFRGSFSASGGKINVAHANNVNTATKLKTEDSSDPAYVGNYGADASLSRLKAVVFYVASNQNGIPALFKGLMNPPPSLNSVYQPEELVDGVYDMQIRFGIDSSPPLTDTIFMADSYNIAPANWQQVVSVEFCISARSNDTGVVPSPQTLNNCDGSQSIVSDGRYRQSLTTLVGLRNLVQ